MFAPYLRSLVPRLVLGVAAGAAILGLSACGGSDVTQARLERSLPATFANLYVQQAKILGHENVTVGSLHARAECDKGGLKVEDRGTGADWICLMNWKDPNLPLPDGTGKFELNVHSNDCYTAAGPSRLIGLVMITDPQGKDVPNPVFEFDACFDPNATNAATGVIFPSILTLPSDPLEPVSGRRVAPEVTCSLGHAGCRGTLKATLAGRTLGTSNYSLAPGAKYKPTFTLPGGARTNGGEIVLVAKPTTGTVDAPSATLAISTR